MGDIQSSAPGTSALGLDLVHEAEIENSLEGSPAATHRGPDTEPTLKELHVKQWRGPRRGQMRTRGSRLASGMRGARGSVRCSKDCGAGPWASRSDMRGAGPSLSVSWVVVGQKQVAEPWNLLPEVQGQPQAGPLPARVNQDSGRTGGRPHSPPNWVPLSSAQPAHPHVVALSANLPFKGVSEVESM